jgi:hypothetical protein
MQWMKWWLEQKEKMRDAYHQDDVLWDKGITHQVGRGVAATDREQIE